MLLSTTSTLQNMQVKEYKGIVCGEVIEGVNFVKDFSAGLTNFFGGRSSAYEEEIINARSEAMNEMISKASGMGANAVIGIDVDYETLGQNMLMVSVTGTAVVVE